MIRIKRSSGGWFVLFPWELRNTGWLLVIGFGSHELEVRLRGRG